MPETHRERLAALAPVLRAAAATFLDRAQAQLGLPLLVVFTYRSAAEQWALYQQGRTYDPVRGVWTVTDPGRVVTRARPGESAHNVETMDGQPAALALDVVPLDAAGRPQWDAPEATWQALYQIASTCGLDPYGDRWGAYLPQDKGHLEEPGWKLKLAGLGLVLPSPPAPPAPKA